MEIEVLTYSKTLRGMIETTAKFYSKMLKLENSTYKVTIITNKNLRKEGSNGLCAKTGPREIAVSLYSRLKPYQMVQTLAHEMVHVKQFAKGQYKSSRMKYGKGYNHFWMGQKVKKEYWSRPWEIEAFARQDVLVDLLFNELKKGNKRKKKS